MDLAGYRPTLGEVAALFDKSSRWISDLRAKGEMPADGATLAEFVAASISHSAGAGGKTIDQHKARLAAAKADQAEMKNAETRRELLPRPHVEQAVQGAFARCRAKLLALPSKSAPIVASMKSAVEVQERLTELVHEALQELAATSIGVAPGGDAGAGGNSRDVVAGVDAAAPADRQPVGRRAPQAKPGGKRRTRAVEHGPR